MRPRAPLSTSWVRFTSRCLNLALSHVSGIARETGPYAKKTQEGSSVRHVAGRLASASRAEVKEKAPSSHLYWARNKSEEKSLTGEHKALSAEEAAALAAKSGPGSSWNKASTWEEKNIAPWATAYVREDVLPSLAYTLGTPEAPPLPKLPDDPSAEGLTPSSSCKVRVSAVDSVKGEATYVLSRGKERVLFELAIKLKLEMELLDEAGALKSIVSGTLNVAEVRGRRRAHRACLHEAPRPAHRTHSCAPARGRSATMSSATPSCRRPSSRATRCACDDEGTAKPPREFTAPTHPRSPASHRRHGSPSSRRARSCAGRA